MDDNRLRFGVGVLVVASLGIAVILTFFFGAYPNLFTSRYTLRVRFPAAPGVGNETPVLKNGVQIGRVTEIRLLNPLSDNGSDGVLITMEIEDKYPLFGTDIPRVTSGSLITGAAQIEFVTATPARLVQLYDGSTGEPRNQQLDPAELEKANQPFDKTETLITYGEVSKDPYEVFTMMGNLETDVRATLVAIQQAGRSVQVAGESIDQLAAQVQSIVGREDGTGELQKLSQKADAVLDQFNSTITEFNEIFGDDQVQANIRKSVETLPRVLENAEGTFATAERTLAEFEGIGKSAKATMDAAQRTAENVAAFTDPLRENGRELYALVEATLVDLDRTLVQIGDFTEKLNRGNGTLNRLIEDDELYWQIKRIAENVEGVTVKIGPIVDDVRVLSDKLARDPRQLGVKGALDSRPSGLGFK